MLQARPRDFRDHRILRGADFAEEAQGEVFSFVGDKL
jgi:hypothetical protein